MPGPLPILTNGRLTIFSVDTLFGQHRINLDVNISNPSGPTPYQLQVHGGALINWDAAADEAVAIFKLFFHTTTLLDQAVLYKFVTGAYQAIATHSTGVSGTLTTPNVPALQQTLTMRDAAYNLDKVVFLECSGLVPTHGTGAALGAPYSTMIASMLGNSSGDIGRWYWSKSNHPVVSELFFTNTFNKRLRRKRGQV